MDLYENAAQILGKVLSKTDSVKSLVFSSRIQNKKALYALVCETLKYRQVLLEILEKCKPLKQEKMLKQNDCLGAVLIYEHLLGRGIKGRYAMYAQQMCAMKWEVKWETVTVKGTKFASRSTSIPSHTQAELMKIRAKVTDIRQLCTPKLGHAVSDLPKYVRINTIQATADEVYKQFQSSDYQLVPCNADSFTDVVTNLDSDKFTTDPHIPNLLVFPPNTDFHDNPLYTSGKIIVQDKASCFPAYILSPPPGARVIDCCAAPGNKTSHLASIMGNKGKVFAFDKSKKRLNTLKQQMQKAGATCVRADCKDFLTIDPNDDQYRDVEYILVDPSCSGSGMINRATQHTDEDDSHSDERLEQLSKFQITILKHSLSFPNVKKVVYSTCSVHEQENEHVVTEVLSKYAGTFQMTFTMPEWLHRGVSRFSVGKFCIRMSHDQALTNGFFVACFERKVDILNNDDCSNRNNELLDNKAAVKTISNESSPSTEERKRKGLNRDNEVETKIKRKKNKMNACKKKRKKNKEYKQ